MSGGLLQFLETLFRRRFWIINLIGISAISLLVALGVNGIIAGQLAALAVRVPDLQAPSSGESDDDGRDDQALQISELLTQEPDEDPVADLTGEPEEEPEEEEPEEEFDIPTGDCQQSSISAILVGTLVDPGGEYSHGIIQDQSTNRTALFRVGMEVAGAEVVAVERERVWVLNEGIEECLKPNEEPSTRTASRTTDTSRRTTPRRNDDEEEEPPTSRSRPVAQREEPAARPNVGSVDDLRGSITRVSPTEYQIDRDAVTAATDNPRMLQSQAPEFQQHFENGRPSGIRLTTIPPGSIFSAIGIRQGDIITEVNGQRVTTAQRAMDLYDALRSENRVEVSVLRRGRARTLSYTIQ